MTIVSLVVALIITVSRGGIVIHIILDKTVNAIVTVNRKYE